MVDRWCSFCGKESEEVEWLIDGPAKVAICNECVDLMYDMVHDKNPRPHGQLAIDLAERRKAKLLGKN